MHSIKVTVEVLSNINVNDIVRKKEQNDIEKIHVIKNKLL